MTPRRIVAALAVAAALVAGCASEDPSTVEGTPETTAATAEPGAGTSTPGTGVGTTTTTGAATPRTIIVGGTDAVPDPPRSTVGAGNPGDGAARWLRRSGAARLVVQVLAQEGAAPPQQALEHLRSVLASVSQKPVSVVAGGAPPAASSWSAQDLKRAAAAAARPSAPEEGVVHLLFVHGASDRGPDTLGVSVAADVAAVFPDRVRDAAGGLASPATLVDAVTMHEVGHLLGLVDLVLKTGRGDPDHPGHSRNAGSVMYWAVESSLIGDLLTGGPPRDFDDRDRADLATIRGG